MMRRFAMTIGLTMAAALASCDAQDDAPDKPTPATEQKKVSEGEPPKPTQAPANANPAVQEEEAAHSPAPDDDTDARLAKVKQAADVAQRIEADSEKLEEILAEVGMSQEEFSALLFELADDAELAEAYAQARESKAERAPDG